MSSADPGRQRATQGQFDPYAATVRLYVLVPAADDHLRIEALEFLFERLKSGALYLGVCALDSEDRSEHLAVESIIVLYGHQYAHLLPPVSSTYLATTRTVKLATPRSAASLPRLSPREGRS